MSSTAWKPKVLLLILAYAGSIANAASVVKFVSVIQYNQVGQAGCSVTIKLDGDEEDDKIPTTCDAVIYGEEVGSVLHPRRSYQFSCSTEATPEGPNECPTRRKICVKDLGCAFVEGSTGQLPCAPGRKRQTIPSSCATFRGTNLLQELV